VYDLLGSDFSVLGSRRNQGECETSSASSISSDRRDEKEKIKRGGGTHLLRIGMTLGTTKHRYCIVVFKDSRTRKKTGRRIEISHPFPLSPDFRSPVRQQKSEHEDETRAYRENQGLFCFPLPLPLPAPTLALPLPPPDDDEGERRDCSR
jgi:hypothetical protein